MRTDSKLTEITVKSYEKLFGKKPLVKGIHAGLECGLFSEKYPDLDMVSFGPTLRSTHPTGITLYPNCTDGMGSSSGHTPQCTSQRIKCSVTDKISTG